MYKKNVRQNDSTPVMRQYRSVKAKYPDALILFRMGDFYETFQDDAKTASRILNITLTKRANGKAAYVPLAGFPYHALETYLYKLLKAGLKVAICDQVEDPKQAKGVVKREVVEIITPGTAVSARFLDEEKNNYLVSVFFNEKGAGIGAIDVSTGEFFLTETNLARMKESVVSLKPSEILCPESRHKEVSALFEKLALRITPLEDWTYSYDNAFRTLTEHFKTSSLKGFGCQKATFGISAAGTILTYLKQNYQNNLSHIARIRYQSDEDFVLVDDFTQRNLEIFQTIQRGEKHGSLIDVIDSTLTPMGSRLLKNWLIHPLRNVSAIQKRHEQVEFFYKNREEREKFRTLLSKCSDLERLLSRLSTNRASARELLALKETLKLIPDLRVVIQSDAVFDNIAPFMNDLSSTVDLLEHALLDDVPLSIKEGSFIRDGYNSTLDEYRNLIRHGKEWIARLQMTERKRLRIPSLKVSYNRVFGYYIEVTKPHFAKVPDNYIRKQTLVNSERFVTEELKEYEEKLLNAEEKVSSLEYEIFQEIRKNVLSEIDAIQKNARAIAKLDVLAGLADLAEKNRYCHPEVHDGTDIIIKNGRHPVVEAFLPTGEKFIPNDIRVDSTSEQILIVTGPNMAGKSTYLRQVGLIVLMAQIGSFVPALEASIGVVDKIFTRVGASDNLAAGESTFLMEMNETANILNNVTPNSLVLLDEIGRGTSTYDGMSLAWAVTEYLHNHNEVAAKTLFATHYHELTELEKLLPRVVNYNVAVKEYGDRIIFLRKIVPGGCDKSYGIHVARMAGIPQEVIHRANEILSNLSVNERSLPTDKQNFSTIPPKDSSQLGLFDKQERQLRKSLTELDINNLTPLEALQKLDELKKKYGI